MAIEFSTFTDVSVDDNEVTLPKPSGLPDGSVLIVQIAHDNFEVDDIPSGWNTLYGSIAGSTYGAGYYRIVSDASAEPASWTWGFAATGRDTAATIGYITNALTSDLLDSAVATAVDASNPTITLSSVTSAHDDAVLLVGISTEGPALTPPAGVTLVHDLVNGPRVAIYQQQMGSAGASGNKVFSKASQTHDVIAWMVAIRNDPNAGPEPEPVGVSGSGSIGGSGTLAIAGTINAGVTGAITGAGSLDIAGSVDLASAGTLAGSAVLGIGAGMDLAATAPISGDASLDVDTLTSIDVDLAASGVVAGVADLTVTAVTSSTVDLASAGALSGDAALVIDGSLAVSGAGAVSGSPAIELEAASMLSAEGAVAVSAALAIDVVTQSPVALAASGAITGAGAIEVELFDPIPDPTFPRTLTLTVRIDGIVTPVRSVRTAHDVDAPTGTGSLTIAAPLPLHVQTNAAVTIHAGWDGDALPIFDGRIPSYDGTFDDRGGVVTVQLEGQGHLLFHSHPTWLGFQGPASLATWWRSVCHYVEVPHFHADLTQDADGDSLQLGTVSEINDGVILIDTRSSPGAEMTRIAKLFGYRHFETPVGLRLQRVSGLPTNDVEDLLLYQEGVNCRRIGRRESLTPMINWWDVWGATYTASDGSEVVIHSAPASVTPDDRLGPYGIAKDEVRDAALDTVALADACRNAHEVDYQEPYSRWTWETRGDAARIPGEQVALSSPKVGLQVDVLGSPVSFPVGCWLMRVEHDISDRGWTTRMEGWQGAGSALPAANDCTTVTLLGSTGVHLGEQTIAYYRNPAPNGSESGTEHHIAFSVVNPYTTLTVRGYAHGTNNFAGGQNSTASRFEIWQDGSRKASGDLPVTGESGSADYDNDAPWHPIVIPLTGSLLAGSAELRIIAGEDSDVDDVDDFELRNLTLTYCGIGAPGSITTEGD